MRAAAGTRLTVDADGPRARGPELGRVVRDELPDLVRRGLVLVGLATENHRADAFISTAERQIEEYWHDDDDESDEGKDSGILCHRMRVEYLVEAGKFAVRAALYTTEEIDAAITRKRGA